MMRPHLPLHHPIVSGSFDSSNLEKLLLRCLCWDVLIMSTHRDPVFSRINVSVLINIAGTSGNMVSPFAFYRCFVVHFLRNQW